MDTTTDLVKSISITNLANQRAAVVERVHTALDQLAEAERIAKAAHLGFPRLVLDDCYACRGRPTVTGDYAKRDEAEGAIVRVIDVRGWSYLLSESGLRSFMDAQAREQWDRQLAEGDVPELTAANIEATFAQLYDARGDMFERGVVQCFRRLSWDYKTNQPFKFGKRIIVSACYRTAARTIASPTSWMTSSACLACSTASPNRTTGALPTLWSRTRSKPGALSSNTSTSTYGGLRMATGT